MLRISEQDLHEEVKYYYYCPKCQGSNSLESEPIGGEELQCENCGTDIEFNYKTK